MVHHNRPSIAIHSLDQEKIWQKKLFVIDFKNVKYSQLVEEATRKGKITLLEDIAEQLDPTLINIVGK
jgi:hypothetical protein